MRSAAERKREKRRRSSKRRGAMAKPSPAASHTPRPASLRSSSTPTPRPPLPANPRDASSNSKGVAKCLAFDDEFTFPDAPDADPADSSSTSLISAASDDAVAASADSALTEVAAPAETTAMVDEEEEEEEEEPLPDQINLALAELRGGRGLSPRSKRLVAALVEAASAELCPTTTTLRLRRAAFWGKVRVWILTAVAAIDVALAVALISRRGNDLYDVLPPT